MSENTQEAPTDAAPIAPAQKVKQPINPPEHTQAMFLILIGWTVVLIGPIIGSIEIVSTLDDYRRSSGIEPRIMPMATPYILMVGIGLLTAGIGHAVGLLNAIHFRLNRSAEMLENADGT